MENAKPKTIPAAPIRTAEILCVGTELLLGDIVNTNAAFLSRRLAGMGISVYHQAVVGDHPGRLTQALEEAYAGHGRPAAQLVILSGGLGPTYDDLTKETVASFFGRDMMFHAESLARIKSYFGKLGRCMSCNNEKQAMMPQGAVVFPNDYGTAPALAVSDGERTAILLPGPPSELEPLFDRQVRPWLSQFTDGVLISRNIHIMGMGEADVEAKLRDLMVSSTNPTLAPYCKEGEVRLRVTARADSEAQATALCDRLLEAVQSSEVGPFIYGVDVENVESALVQTLTRLGLTIACAESCTGGMLGERITSVPGASAVFAGGCITYTNRMKVEQLGVSQATIDRYTEVSAETAAEMAVGVRQVCHTDLALSTTGYAGPGGGTPEHPVGTVFVGIASDHGVRTLKLSYAAGKTRDYIRRAAASRAFLEAIREVMPENHAGK